MIRQDEQVIVPPAKQGLFSLRLREILERRELLYMLVWREVKARYRQSALGPLWFLVQPLMQVVFFTVIFGYWVGVESDGAPYPLFAFCALLPWQYFSSSTSLASSSILRNMSLISKVYFPRLLLPVVPCATGMVDSLITFVLLFAMLLFYRQPIGLHLLFLPLYLVLVFFFSLACGIWIATSAVVFRDAIHGIRHILSIGFYLSPIVYPLDKVPLLWRGIPVRALYRLNPITEVIVGFRFCILGKGEGPGWFTVLAFGTVLVLCVSGVIVFQRQQRQIVDHL